MPLMNQPSESFNALLIALGLWEPDIPYPTADSQKQSINSLNGRTSRIQMEPSHMGSHSEENSLPTDEASLFGREFLSDFEICLDEESDGDYGWGPQFCMNLLSR